ncbi:MAG: GAF domain-containing SpoIIE family protein phosphatase [Planctomycetota bacterium]
MAFWRRRGSQKSDEGTPATTGGAAVRPPSAGADGAGVGAKPGAAAGGAPGIDLDPPTAFLKGDAQADRKSLHLLLDAIARVSASRDLESLLHYVVDSSLEATGAERGFLVLIDPVTGDQVVRVAREAGGKQIEDDVKYSTSVVARVMDSGEPVRTTVQKNAEDLDLGNSIYDLKIRAVMCVPLVPRDGPEREKRATVGGLPRGALYVDSKATTRAFKVEDLSLFFALAQHIAIALENAHLNIQSLEKARLERSLEIASEIQAGLLPKGAPTVAGFELFGWYRPAEHASGDFYDFVRSKSGGTSFVVGDVTGHGVGPALVTATAQASLRSYARVLDDPGEVVSMLNADLSERVDPGMFLTLFFAQLGEGGLVRTLNAGQTPPLIWRTATGTIDSLRGDGPALGMISDFAYTTGATLTMEPGDLLIAFTDGIVEARHPSFPDRLFDDAGVRAVLADAGHRGLSAEETVAAIATAVLEFSNGVREDDMTIVAVRRTRG